MCCKLFRFPYSSQQDEEDFEDTHNTSIKSKYYLLSIMLYALYLMAVLPKIQV